MTDRDLFGEIPKPKAKDFSTVRRVMVEHPAAHTDDAWMLSMVGRGPPKHAPRSQVTQDPQAPQVFVMPRWLAEDRGWL